jgi:micrococcal nuclease
MSRRYIRKKHIPWLAPAITILIFLGQEYGWFSKLNVALNNTDPGLYTVSHYIDGDTIIVSMNGSDQTIRFIGIDTPETHKPNTPVQCYGPAAAAHTQAVIKNVGGKVRLQSDALSSNRDRYDRLLRYVYLADGTNVNLLNVQQGYAFYYPYFPYTKSAQFESAQRQAMTQKIGLWKNCHPTPSDDGGYKMDETQAEATQST